MPIEFIETGIQAKINEIYDYRIYFNELNSERMKDTFKVYTRDMINDGYNLISEGVEKFYPDECNTAYIEKVTKWYNAVEEMLLDLRFELSEYFNINNPYIELSKRKKV